MIGRRTFLFSGIAAAGLATAGGAIYRNFRATMNGHERRIGRGSRFVETRFGTVEYATAGAGSPVMMIHGTGGGFDQGLAMSQPLIAAGFQVIAPSRFGYLRSSFPLDPSAENQADAIAELMDRLDIGHAAIIGVSAGALSALQFAIRHPTRCSALIALVPATYVPGRAPVRPGAIGAAIMEYGLKSDFLFWAGLELAEDRMIATILATDPLLVHNADPVERRRALSILHDILPISARSRGLLNDGRAAGTPEEMDLAAITAPTLAISVEDDAFGTFAAAQHIGASVAGAEFIGYPAGGHVFVNQGAQVYKEIIAFLTANSQA